MIANPETLYLVSYFNQAVSGYNPWEILRSAKVPLLDGTGAIQWQSLKDNIPNLSTSDLAAFDSLQKRVKDGATRATGRINFCRALELSFLTESQANDALETWSIDPAISTICLAILSERYAGTGTMTTDPALQEVVDLINQRNNVVLYGPPGTGKTHAALQIKDAWEAAYGAKSVFAITFHPSYGYEDFVHGFRPLRESPEKYTLQEGALLRACDAAISYQKEAPSSEESKKCCCLSTNLTAVMWQGFLAN